ncbi:unnamed protein product [Blumeria hordei]|uniref:Rap-GAP domain-containing protein n=1 Tax=Blumeria hordei TaxID=2867405 RepID=A0A383UV74_BLUHO|nr:unnamed protein product [Blumeria hordei]
MSQPVKDAVPESKPMSGFVNVFKSLTGIRPTKTTNLQLQSSGSQQTPKTSSPFHKIHKELCNFESLIEQLGNENSLSTRTTAATYLCTVVQQYPGNRVSRIFNRAKDLINPSNPSYARAAGFKLLTACVENIALTGPERLAYFRTFTAPADPEDFHLQVSAVIELAKHGRDLAGFHYEIFPLLTLWLRRTWNFTWTRRKQRREISLLNGEPDFMLLLVFIVDVIKFNFNISSEDSISDLIDVVLNICVCTSSSDELRLCIHVINAVVTYGDIPGSKLADCVKVLCSTHCLVIEMQQDAWKSISNICISHNGEKTVAIAFEILRDPYQGSKLKYREVRGALSVLEKLFLQNGEKGYPLVPFTVLVNSLSKVTILDQITVKNDVLRLILSILGNDGQELLENVVAEDWTLMFEVIIKCTNVVLEIDTDEFSGNSGQMDKPDEGESKAEITPVHIAENLRKLVFRIQTLLIQNSDHEFFQRTACIKFLVTVHRHLPEACAKLVIDTYTEYRYCHPSDPDWKENTFTIFKSFYSRNQPSKIRLHTLKTVTSVYEVVEDVNGFNDMEITQSFVELILQDIASEKDISILQEVLAFAVKVADATCYIEIFDLIISKFREGIISEQISSKSEPTPLKYEIPISSNLQPNSLHTSSGLIANSLVEIFMHSMDKSKIKSNRIFNELLWVAECDSNEIDARISALKMLFRLRADWAKRIFLISHTESEGLAAVLNRTSGSLSRKKILVSTQQQRLSQADDLILGQTITGYQSVQDFKQTIQKSQKSGHHPQIAQYVWIEPEVRPLPQHVFGKSSSVLASALDNELEDMNKGPIMALDIALYLKTIINILKSSCDWEIYSYIIVHLPSQLTNQALFKAAIPQIKSLRELLCEHIKNNSIQEPPTLLGLRKSDVMICFYQMLNVVMSYHRHFSKNDGDEIVRTFLQGVGERTSKCCMHALSICCHELPRSTRKVIVTVLTKMSQIITQSHVAIHILEFLACLARLPKLYVNFREEEFRIVFAICFRYLQCVRDQKDKDAAARNNTYSKTAAVTDNSRTLPDTSFMESNFYLNTSEDLPQYVYALAHHVIIFWFLSMKLADRAGQVSWITKNLVSIDTNGKENIDEQAQVTIDFMQRVAFADIEESGPDPSFKEDMFGEIKKKRWIIGNSLVTIEQATRGDWAQITKRQPSGTSSYIIQENFSRPSSHQSHSLNDDSKNTLRTDESFKLPSHLILQLFASVPSSGEYLRPIPLPDCKAMDRAISNFNRTFTVDGHKVGVIYVGENQKNEVDILSNIHGSSDYIRFLSGLGTLTKLRGANFNTQGLDRQTDADGEYTFCWRDRVTEIIFHVTTQMPTNLNTDPQCSNKKRHIGNDFVNIIFNNSGLPFDFNTFPSEFNYVNIVITPESRATFVARRLPSSMEDAFFKVQVKSKPGFPEISPAAETKIMSLSNLPDFIRLLALNASVFCLVWANRVGGEHFSSWRNRLREIKKIREQYGQKQSELSPPGTSHCLVVDSKNTRDNQTNLRRSSVVNFLTQASETVSQRSQGPSVVDSENELSASQESLVDTLDFSKWT